MQQPDDPVIALAAQSPADDFSALGQRPVQTAEMALPAPSPAPGQPALATLHGFDLLEQPLVSGLAQAPGLVLPARSTVPLRRGQRGQQVLLMFIGGDLQQPCIIGVVAPQPLVADAPAGADGAPGVAGPVVQADGERLTLSAEREIVLRCGEASITLTRAGKVIIQGSYILSRSTGYNKLKGAAIDIN